MDYLTRNHCIVIFIHSPEAILFLEILLIFIIMNLLLYLMNRKLCMEELTSSVFIVKYDSHPFLRYGVIHCISLQGQKIDILDPGFVFRKHVQKISPREINEIKFQIEFHWRLILTIYIKIMEIDTKSLGLKTTREYVQKAN